MTFPANPGMYPQQSVQPNDSNYSQKINESLQFGDSVTDNPSFSPIRTPPLSFTQSSASYLNPNVHYNDPPPASTGQVGSKISRRPYQNVSSPLNTNVSQIYPPLSQPSQNSTFSQNTYSQNNMILQHATSPQDIYSSTYQQVPSSPAPAPYPYHANYGPNPISQKSASMNMTDMNFNYGKFQSGGGTNLVQPVSDPQVPFHTSKQSSSNYLANSYVPSQESSKQTFIDPARVGSGNFGFQGHPALSGSTSISRPAPSTSLDPRQIPSPLIAQELDQQLYDQTTYVPCSGMPMPFSNTIHSSIDNGVTVPKMLRSTVQEFPSSENLLKSSGLIVGLVVQPFAPLHSDETPISLVNTGELGPIRCDRCRGYINVHCCFIEGGRRFICCLCGAESIVPIEYACSLDASGRRLDRENRPELMFGSVDLTASKEYCNRPPKPPCLVLIIDVSAVAAQSGAMAGAFKAIHSYVSSYSGIGQPLPMPTCLITFDSTVHFYTTTIVDSKSTFKMHVIPDVLDASDPPQLPAAPSQLFTNNPEILLRLTSSLPGLFHSSQITHAALGPTLLLAAQALSSTGGRISVFSSQMPNAGPGSLAPRDSAKLPQNKGLSGNVQDASGTEKAALQPQIPFYQALGESFVSQGISVDLFACPVLPASDVATYGAMATVTGGRTYAYLPFRVDRDEFALIRDFVWALYRPAVYDVLIRLRVGNGLSVRDMYGNFYMRNATDMEFARLDSDSTFAVSLGLDGSKIAENSRIPVQVAILHTDVYGSRKIRLLHTLLTATTSPQAAFRTADVDTTMTLLCKSAIGNVAVSGWTALKQHLIERAILILGGYRRLCSSTSSTGQLILPEALKLLPLYLLGLLKSKLFRDSRDLSIDRRIWLLRTLKAADAGTTETFIYPKLYQLLPARNNNNTTSEVQNHPDEKMVAHYHKSKPDQTITFRDFKPCPLTATLLDYQNMYLLENGLQLMLWIGHQVSMDNINDLFGVSTLDLVPSWLPGGLTSNLANRVSQLIGSLEARRSRALPLIIIRQHMDPTEGEFLQYMIEDKGPFGNDYVDFLCFLHSQINSSVEK